jgi:hypothetical protein
VLKHDSAKQEFVYQGDRNHFFEGLAAGNYTLSVSDLYNNNVYRKIAILSDSAACNFLLELEKESSNQKNTDKKGFFDEEAEAFYQLYPNPTTGQYRLDADLSDATPITIRLYTMHGTLLKEWKSEGQKQYSFTDYAATQGVYVIEVETEFGKKEFKLSVIR